MKVKMVDVARRLGISKATVSLAVNGKPGVNEETKRKIFACIEEMKSEPKKEVQEQEKEEIKSSVHRLIKVLIINHKKQVVCDPELDLWSEVLATFDSEARKRGYLYGLSYVGEEKEETDAVIEECNMDFVAGIILFATEMTKEDYRIVEKIKKPMVIYDYEMPNGKYSSVCIDNKSAVKNAVHLLHQAGARDIRYFCTGKEIYNFEKRKEAFVEEQLKKGGPEEKKIVELGNTIEKISENMAFWLEKNKLPEGMIFENYQVSIGVMMVLRKYRVPIPKEVKVVGIDEVPGYILPDGCLTQIKIPHAERASMAMELLDKEIQNLWSAKVKVFAEPEVLLKNSL